MANNFARCAGHCVRRYSVVWLYCVVLSRCIIVSYLQGTVYQWCQKKKKTILRTIPWRSRGSSKPFNHLPAGWERIVHFVFLRFFRFYSGHETKCIVSIFELDENNVFDKQKINKSSSWRNQYIICYTLQNPKVYFNN